jgi:hypothetical protein
MDIKGIGCEGMDWIHLTRDRVRLWTLVSMIINQWVP